MVFDKIINITVFKAGNIVAGKRTIGSFRCDVGTVYATADHQYYHKWAPLIDPKDMSAGPKGFVKCDISVSGKGDILKAPKGGKEDDSDNIEGNLLLPAGVALDRQRAVYQVIIYRGEDLPRTDFGIFTSMRNAISLNKVAFVDAYVKVSFVGHIGKTSSKKSYNPDWKEILTFTDMFPPLCNRIKIQICDSDPIKDDPIGTHFIELSQIMDPGGDTDGILPSFGPSFINFYGSPRRYNIQGGSDELNEGLGEGSAYRGRLLMQLTTTILDAESGGVSSVSREKLLRTGGQSDFKPRKELILFATLFEAAMINGEFANKSVYFEISIGKYGNTIDSKGRAKLFEKTDDEESDEEEESSRILKERKEEEDELFKFSSTPAQNAISIDNTYCYMPWKEEKPCLFVGALFEDERKRLYHSNMIQGMSDKMEEGLEDTGQMIKNDHELSHRRLRGVIEEFEHGLDDYMRHAPLLGVGAGAGKTNLDRHRLNFCKNSLDKFKQQVKKIRKSVKPANVRDKYYEMKRIAGKVRRMARDPQHGLPDVFLWMIVEKKRVAYYRFPARSLLNATTDDQRGRHCGEMQTIFLRKPGMKGLGSTGWAMQAKLQVLLWLGERDKNGSNPKYLQNLPPGYECKYTMYQDQSPPPTSIVYPQSHKFELRAFVFCARSLIGSDNSGLSDPFARIIVGNQCKTTQVAFETLSPRWEETFVFKDLVFNGPLEEIQKSPPIVIVEFYDHDMVGDPEYLGRCIIHPKVKVENEPYCAPEWPAQPEWWDVYRGTSLSGEMLACFELLHGDTSDAPVLPDPIPIDPRNPQLTLLRIPPMIMPPISTYRIEVLFWGVRDFKRQLLSSVSRPRIDVEVAGKILRSRRIESLGRHSNFEEPLQYFDLDMPDNEMWWPPLTIRCVDCKNFGRENLVGTCTVNFLANYVFVPLEERQRVAEESRQQLLKERYETSEKSAADNMSIKSGQPSHLVASDNKTLLSVKTNGGAADTRSIRSGHVSIAMGDVPNVDIKSTRGSVMHLSPVPEGQEDSKSLDWWSKYYVKKRRQEEEADALSGKKKKKKKKKKIKIKNPKESASKFKFYEHELENIPEFGGFEELLHTFDLLKGKKTNDEEEDCARLSGKFKTKGSLEAIKAKPKINLKLAPEIPFHKSYDLHVRVYVIRAFDLHPADLNGKSDPYLIVKCGRHVTNDKANRIMNMLNPCFGKLFEFNVTFPVDSMLRVQVMDYDKLSADDIIGETVIDLENRILSKHRPRCGIQQQYDTFGYNQWRDCIQPTAIVERLCKDVKMQNPDYRRDSVYIAGRIYYAEGEIENDAGEMIPTRELLAMEILKHWDEIPGGCKLVPEHVETRVLYNPDKPGIEQGRLEMWVDIFPKDLPMPSVTIDITPRLPISYELRIIIWNTDDVILEDKNVLTGEMSSDIFVRGYLKGPALDGQQTDIHYRSLTGEGNFNWRFVFPFDYLKAEEKAVYTIKEGVFDASETEQKIPPQITLQVWDADIVSSDDFLGSVVLDMNRIPKPAKNLKNCSLKMLKKDGSVPTLNLFKNKRCKGWWPMSVKEPDGELKLVGKVEAEFHLCEAEEAERSPVGCAREDPEGLQEPNRPDSSFFWLTNPLKTMKYVLWKNYKWLIFKLVLLLLLLVFIILFFYTVPSATVNKIWDIMGS
ncbi:hypothetical protein CAPTEDRAFT_184805 [Capitella teleta]|uniref:C2 domain-containing protein n=1 Tax=Capitella teleta TaxID=283909 RepID=R7UMD0_CAPTE|nr:hypothetical protein CAPTEDRAFT_184805 [Capitella teleta]|eukprot:ELU05062.1 hypothetical protein CAPTEDRAFT_184805 [Capitella teleta]